VSGISRLKKLLKRPYLLTSMFIVDPLEPVTKWRGLPYFVGNARRYQRRNTHPSLRFRLGELWFRSYDRFAPAASLTFHYFHQDLWAATYLYSHGTKAHVDVGSRVDGFIAHILPFCDVTYVDIRPLDLQRDGFRFRRGSLTDLPFADGSVQSLSCLHVIEHVGLGRYGDAVDPDGHITAARELSRVLAPGGTLLLSTPVGRERVCFDAHRVFDPATIAGACTGLRLEQFSLIDDVNRLHAPATFDAAKACEYGCGLFVFSKPGMNAP
jgi:SAM-dependent methyltransferase